VKERDHPGEQNLIPDNVEYEAQELEDPRGCRLMFVCARKYTRHSYTAACCTLTCQSVIKLARCDALPDPYELWYSILCCITLQLAVLSYNLLYHPIALLYHFKALLYYFEAFSVSL
jgi:hypothetical protein